MNRMLLCLLPLSLVAAGTGCHAIGRTSNDLHTGAPLCSTQPMACEDNRCQPGPLAPDGAACESVRCGHAGPCLPSLCGIHACLKECAHRKCAGLHCGLAEGPTMGAVTYPYYTVRGPRDFLLDDPPSIGR